MTGKIYLYLLMTVLTLFAFSSVNINSIFKKNKEIQANIFYLLLVLAISYLVTNYLYDLYLIIQ